MTRAGVTATGRSHGPSTSTRDANTVQLPSRHSRAHSARASS